MGVDLINDKAAVEMQHFSYAKVIRGRGGRMCFVSWHFQIIPRDGKLYYMFVTFEDFQTKV